LVINIQPIEKLDAREDESVEVHSIFYTIQGEGPLTGHPAIFVRLAGCNLQCPLCDTEYTSKRERMSPERVVREVSKLHPGPRLVVITGGEPFRQNITLLCLLLGDSGYQVQVESNGTLPPPPGFPGFDADVWLVVSPKTGKVHPRTAERANAWKYVAQHHNLADDGLPITALDHTAHPRLARPPADFPVGAIYLQPVDMPYANHAERVHANNRNQDAVLRSCLEHGYTLQLQIHKILGME
jgi:7-carboxy-7-deazaguanine synthase